MSPNSRSSVPNDAEHASPILSPVKAAHFLGVTPELLFAYAIYPPKKNLGHNISLPYVKKDSYEGFRQSALESFDAYLREPWSESSASRPAIPTYVVDYLKVECGGQCARCGKGYKLENAHIVPYADTRSHHHHNLIRLCSECHEKYDAKPTPLISREEIQTLKDQLIVQVRERLLRGAGVERRKISRIPNPASQFVGREHEIGVLVEALGSSRSISIQGSGGIGKTQLLLNALHRVSDECPVFWINVEAYSSVPDLELALAAALSEAGTPIPAHAVVDALAETEVRIVFDGVERMSPADMDDLEDFFRNLLEMTTAPQFIFTSQAELNGLDIATRLRMETLNDAAAMLILRSALDPEQLETSDTEKHLRWLESFCEGHPLSLQLAAALLRYFKSASVVVGRILRSGASVLQSPTRKRQTTSTSLRACLLVSYQSLTTNQRKVLWLSSQCPAGCLVEMLDEREMYGFDDLDGDIAALRHWHLLEVYAEALDRPRLYVLSPIRAFVETEWETEAPTNVEELRYALVGDLTTQAMVLNFKYVQGKGAAFGVFRFDQEFPNLIQALRTAVNRASTDERYLEFVVALATSLMVYCFVRGLFERGTQIMRLGADAAIQLGQKEVASNLLLQLLTLGERSHNIKLVQNAAAELALLAEGDKKPRILANAEMAKGNVALIEGRLDEAANHFAAAISYYQQAIHSTAALTSSTLDSGSKENLLEGDDSAQQLLSMALKQQGFVYEMAQRPSEALPFYEQALSIVIETNDQINLGSILHGIGNCAAESGQPARAFESYIAAAEQFHSIGIIEHISNSLSELGHLLVDWNPPVPVDSFISEDLLTDGLSDTAEQIVRVFAHSFPNLPFKLTIKTIRKAFGMIALASFSCHNELLADWAYVLREDMLRPLLNELESGKQESLDTEVPLMYLDLTLSLAGTLSGVEQPNGLGPTPALSEIEHYAWLLYKYFDYGWRVFRPFEWLATYLRRHRGLHNLSATLLQNAIIEAQEYGQSFSLPDL